MLVLDTDHLSAMGYATIVGKRLIERLESSGREVCTTAISVDEQLSGLLAAIHARREPEQEIEPYAELVARVEFLASFMILPWDDDAVQRFEMTKGAKVKAGTMDLKIASIVMAHDAILLTRNVRDFAQVPGLRFENWMD